ncbi:Single-stranded DNA-binding protein DdrB [Dissostichus eleginoides]|uniref:Single-stranded DNA-binding protein DdrB n=1 Tax=Dissostichus eleginoides TaxID=100907 RepID=A0AAD9EZ87_DISEL|nr:Single-stranded DNA-binding protein DdrB [Dissostichus eleginoides]
MLGNKQMREFSVCRPPVYHQSHVNLNAMATESRGPLYCSQVVPDLDSSYRPTATSVSIILSFFPLGRRRCFKAEVTTRELKFPTGSRWARGLARTRTRKALSSPNWIQMAVFVQGHRQHRHWECGEGNDSEGRGCSCTALRSQRPGWRSAGCVVPVAPDTPVPLDTESGDTLGFNHGLNYVLSGSRKETGSSNITSYKYWG